MSEDRSAIYDRYLSLHFAHVNDQSRFRARKVAYYQHNYRRHLPSDAGAHILDVGPGYGEFLELLSRSGYARVEGVDLSPEVAEFCNKLLPGSTQAVADTVAFFRARPATFDLVSMFHVLEHVPKPEVIPLLQAVHQSLTIRGRLIVEVPNMANPVIGLNVRYADFTHESGFTELSLAYVLGTAGFQSVQVFEPRLTPDRWERPLQNAVQALFRSAVRVTYRAYGQAAPRVLGRAVSAVAER
jgi:2-polyprenyl-3-methyl-5-hydroxy-6-metoxy-1,4-benzoquinol methylase